MTDTKYLYQYFLEKSLSDKEKKQTRKKAQKKSLKPQKASQTPPAEVIAYE
jgi:hypothetical protein